MEVEIELGFYINIKMTFYSTLDKDTLSVLYEHQCNNPMFLTFLFQNGYHDILKKNLKMTLMK